jgi:hypothetical protein
LNSTIDLLDSRTDEDALKLLRNAAQSVTGAERSLSTFSKGFAVRPREHASVSNVVYRRIDELIPGTVDATPKKEIPQIPDDRDSQRAVRWAGDRDP